MMQRSSLASRFFVGALVAAMALGTGCKKQEVAQTPVTRTDAGNEVPNVSEILGAGTSSSISALYYPSAYRTWTKVGQRWLTNVIIDGFTFSVKEFWPDVNNAIFHQKD